MSRNNQSLCGYFVWVCVTVWELTLAIVVSNHILYITADRKPLTTLRKVTFSHNLSIVFQALHSSSLDATQKEASLH